MKGLLFTHHTRATFDFDRNETVKGFWVNLFDPHRFAIRQRLGSSPGVQTGEVEVVERIPRHTTHVKNLDSTATIEVTNELIEMNSVHTEVWGIPEAMVS
jgi:hypothetical protein